MLDVEYLPTALIRRGSGAKCNGSDSCAKKVLSGFASRHQGEYCRARPWTEGHFKGQTAVARHLEDLPYPNVGLQRVGSYLLVDGGAVRCSAALGVRVLRVDGITGYGAVLTDRLHVRAAQADGFK